MPHVKNKSNASTYQPTISYQQAKESWFTHKGQPYSVAGCSASLFRDAVLSLMPQWASDENYNGFLAASKIDPVIRWYLLCSLSEAKRPLTIYSSKQETVQALHCHAPGQCV
jgi:hypothetical protein